MIINNDTCQSTWTPENKAIIGGNFCHWYGGFQSYITATEFNCPIFVPASHCKRSGEEQVPNLNHLNWALWTEWMSQLSKFKYAVNLMPTIAAGTFSLNCAYFGIPCIGNEKVDTQIELFPELSIDVNDVHMARGLALQLRENTEFYNHCSYYAKSTVRKSKHMDTTVWLEHMYSKINNKHERFEWLLIFLQNSKHICQFQSDFQSINQLELIFLKKSIYTQIINILLIAN